MCTEGKINDLIEAGWEVIYSDFNPIAFHHWRRRAFDCLTDILGPDHVYTRQFGYLVQKDTKTDLIVARGIMSAVQQGIVGDQLECSQ